MNSNNSSKNSSNLKLIFWETTRACNLGCPHCRASAQNFRSQDELTTLEAMTFMNQAASFSRPILVFSGGEPLLREDIYELASYAHRLGLKPAIATNATLITEDIAYKLKENNVKLVAVSLYGASAQAHDDFCGLPGAFQRSLLGIENVSKASLQLQINTTVTKKNLDELENMACLAQELGAGSFHVFFLVPTGRGKAIEGDEISPQEYEQAFNRLYELQLKFPLKIKATCAPHYYRLFYQRGSINSSKIDGWAHLTKGCLAGQGVCFISYSGQVFGCGYLPIPAGSLRIQDFRTIWFQSPLFETLRDESLLEGKCGTCEFRRTCGGCRARAYATGGNYLAEEPGCAYQPLTVKS
jgi:heme b synthase